MERLFVERDKNPKPQKIKARKWDLYSSHPYKRVRVQFQTLFILLRKEIRHDHAGSYWLTTSSGTKLWDATSKNTDAVPTTKAAPPSW